MTRKMGRRLEIGGERGLGVRAQSWQKAEMVRRTMEQLKRATRISTASRWNNGMETGRKIVLEEVEI